MKKLFALVLALIVAFIGTNVSAMVADVSTKTDAIYTIDIPQNTKDAIWERRYKLRCRATKRLKSRSKKILKRILLAPLTLFFGVASAEPSKLDDVKVLNEGNPITIGEAEGHLFTVSPGTAKKDRGYYTDKPVPLTKWEKKMPGVVVCQNRGMLFSSHRLIKGDVVIPSIDDLNLIVVDEKSEKLKPTDTPNAKIEWVGNGEHTVKEVGYDGAGQHWFTTKAGKLAVNLWFKTAKGLYGLKGVVQPGLATDVGAKVVDHWQVKQTITLGNTLVINTSMLKGNVYNSLEECKAHSKEWGLDKLMAQWQSGDHRPTGRRPMGTQPIATNLELTAKEIVELLKPEALAIWAMQFVKIAWMKSANIKTARGRALAARPSLMFNDLIMHQIDTQAGNKARKLAQGKFMAKGAYLKLFPDKLAYSLMYIHGMSRNEAAKKAADTGLHGKVRVNPAFAGRYFVKNEDGQTHVAYKEKVGRDEIGVFIEATLVRYPHGAPSETIIHKLYLDETVPEDVIIIPLPVANDDGTIPAKDLLCLRLQGADFDGDAVTAYIEKIWLEAQRRNEGKPYMVIPVNTESTEKDKTLVTDESFESFCQMKVESLSNQVGLIATHLKYLVSQMAESLRLNNDDAVVVIKSVVAAAIAMGNDIDEFKHGKAVLEMALFQLEFWDGKVEYLKSPYYNRYAMKYRTLEDFDKARLNKDGSEKIPGSGSLDRFAVAAEQLMIKAGIPFEEEVGKASDGTDRYYYTVHPVKWQSRNIELFIAENGQDKPKGHGHRKTALPTELERVYGVEPGTLFTAGDLFKLLFRDHSANCNMLLGADEDTDRKIKVLNRINERYGLAKLAVVVWTQRMKKAKDDVDLTVAEALKLFTTLMVQHPGSARSVIETYVEHGVFEKQDGSVYEKDIFAAQRKFNYFLDLCGDGLFLIGQEKPNFPAVSDNVLAVAQTEEPDMTKAKENIQLELNVLEDLVKIFNQAGVTAVSQSLNDNFLPPPDDDEGSVDLSEMDFPISLRGDDD